FSLLLFFFFQAEDGIRGFHVTGVQTCALPIFLWCPNKYPTQKRSSGKSKRPIRNWGSTLKSRLAILGWSHQPVNLISSSDSVSGLSIPGRIADRITYSPVRGILSGPASDARSAARTDRDRTPEHAFLRSEKMVPLARPIVRTRPWPWLTDRYCIRQKIHSVG